MKEWDLQSLKHQIFCIYYVCVIYIVSIWYTLLQLVIPHRKPKLACQEGRVALITGGGRGIGYETACQLLKAGMSVIIVGIEEDQREGVNDLKKEYKDCVKFLSCNLSSLKSVRQLAIKFKALNLPLHLLINNAGIMFAPRIETDEGFESHWVINYLSHFLLTHLLLETLIKSTSDSQPSRIVNLASCLHYPGTINFTDTQGKTYYSAEAAYTQSKLAMVMFASALARRLQDENIPVLVNSVHPAVAFSGLYRYIWWVDWIPNLARRILKTPAMASDTVVHTAVSSEVTDGGNYYENCNVETPSKEAQSLAIQEELFQLSCMQVAIAEFGKADMQK